MNSPVFDPATLRFGRLLHYSGLAVVLIIGAAAHGWFCAPVDGNIVEAQLKLDELAVTQQNADAIRIKHAALSDLLTDIQARFAALEQRVPASADAGSFLRYVSEIARQEKLAISSFRPAQPVAGEGFSALEVMLDGQGSYQSICAFFARLAKIQRLSKLRDLTVLAHPGSDDYPMQATIVIYFGLQDEAADAPAEEVRRG